MGGAVAVHNQIFNYLYELICLIWLINNLCVLRATFVTSVVLFFFRPTNSLYTGIANSFYLSVAVANHDERGHLRSDVTFVTSVVLFFLPNSIPFIHKKTRPVPAIIN